MTGRALVNGAVDAARAVSTVVLRARRERSLGRCGWCYAHVYAHEQHAKYRGEVFHGVPCSREARRAVARRRKPG